MFLLEEGVVFILTIVTLIRLLQRFNFLIHIIQASATNAQILDQPCCLARHSHTWRENVIWHDNLCEIMTVLTFRLDALAFLRAMKPSHGTSIYSYARLVGAGLY